eukprot:m51a1_g1642 hypothetical protein (271) ;mRNA; f:328821-329633
MGSALGVAVIGGTRGSSESEDASDKLFDRQRSFISFCALMVAMVLIFNNKDIADPKADELAQAEAGVSTWCHAWNAECARHSQNASILPCDLIGYLSEPSLAAELVALVAAEPFPKGCAEYTQSISRLGVLRTNYLDCQFGSFGTSFAASVIILQVFIGLGVFLPNPLAGLLKKHERTGPVALRVVLAVTSFAQMSCNFGYYGMFRLYSSEGVLGPACFEGSPFKWFFLCFGLVNLLNVALLLLELSSLYVRPFGKWFGKKSRTTVVPAH